MRVRYAVTFEFDTQSPITHRGTVAAATMPTCFARAARDAARAHPGLKWSSMTCVLLERLDATTANTSDSHGQVTEPLERVEPCEPGRLA